ncbi:MAG: hypothetical protein V4529_17380 [Gemmatimonadota bacterium]
MRRHTLAVIGSCAVTVALCCLLFFVPSDQVYWPFLLAAAWATGVAVGSWLRL